MKTAEKRFWPIAIALLTVLAAVQFLTIVHESQTWDEAIEIASGYSYWKTAEYRVILEHPPLERLVATLPLVLFLPPLKLDLDAIRRDNMLDLGNQLVYHSGTSPQTILLWARATAILTTIAVGLALAVWARAEFGASAALFALTLFAFDPTVIAHGRYVKNDMLAALFCLLAGASWLNYLRSNTRKSLILAGVFFGLAAGTKFSAGFLLPVFLTLAIVHCWRERHTRTILKTTGALLGVCAIAFLVIGLIYAPYAKDLLPTTQAFREAHPSIKLLRNVADRHAVLGQVLFWFGKTFGLRAHPFYVGLNSLAQHNYYGHPSYLLGQIGNGWWYYFPVAFAVKTPIVTLLILAAAIVLAFRRRAGSQPAAGPRPALAYWLALLSVVTFLGMSMASHINIGIRHLLPMYPFLFALLGASLARWNPRIAILACGLVALESLAIYPDYTAFFNVAVGGPGNGPKYLLDSNIDWGQDLPKLKAWLDARHQEQVCITYFGTAETGAYGIAHGIDLPNEWNTAGREKMDCYAAASATPLFGLYSKPGEYDYLLKRQPVAKVGYSIYVYDLRKQSNASPDSLRH